MPTINRDGVAIRYEDNGNSDGIPVLLTHGFGASVEMWDTQVAAFEDELRLIRWDMRGHGLSDCPSEPSAYSQADTVGDVAALLDALNVESAVIGGHSLGGFMSLAFHAAHPDRTQALYLQGCGPGYRSESSRTTWNERAESRARSLEDGGLAALGGGAEVTVSVQRSADGLAGAARGILSQVDSTVIDSLPTIAVPTLIVIGDGDTPYLTGSEYMASRIPGAKSVVVEGAGHGVNVEQPEIVNELLREFFSRLTP